MPLSSGTSFGRYRIRQRLGIGGMGEVYLANALGPDGIAKQVAIKLIRELHQHRQELVSMFIEEAKVAFLLTHPNIVQTYDIGQVEGHYFLVMEYVDCIDLAQFLSFFCKTLGQPIPVRFALYIGSQIARALAYAHQLQDSEGHPLSIVHRDVSPSNVLLAKDGQVKITDFGLAISALRKVHSATGLIKGKVAYMSPEQLAGETVDARADIYSTGVVLFELLSGQNPFGEPTEVHPLSRYPTADVPALSTMAPHVDADLGALVDRCLAEAPQQRHQSARELGRALDQLIREKGLAATDYELSDFIAQAQKAASVEPSTPHPFDQALGMELQKIDAAGGLSTFIPAADETLLPLAQASAISYPSSRAEAWPAKTAAVSSPSVADAQSSSTAAISLGSSDRLTPPHRRLWPILLLIGLGSLGIFFSAFFLLSEKPAARQHLAGDNDAAGRLHDTRPGLAQPLHDGPQPRTGQAELHIEAEAPGLSVLIDGKPFGRPPVMVKGLPAGRTRVQLLRGGQAVFDEQVTLEPGATITLRPAGLERPAAPRDRRIKKVPRPSGTLSINSEPWSMVYLDGKRIRSTPLIGYALPAGTYSVKLVNPKLARSTMRKVTISAHQETRLSVELDR